MNIKRILSFFVKHKKKAIIFIIISSIGIGGTVWVRNNNSVSGKPLAKRTTAASVGEIITSVSGSGALTTAERVTLASPGNAMITELPFKAGDMVKKGNLIFRLNDSEPASEVFKNTDAVNENKFEVDNLEKSIKELTILSPMDGVVTSISVSKGDAVSKGTAVLTIKNTSKYKVTLPFNSDDADKMNIGDSAEVFLQNLMEVVKGKVTYINDYPYSNSDGVRLRDVEITLNNPGALNEGMAASADVLAAGARLSSLDNGKLRCASKCELKSSATGNVKSINIRTNQFVKKGQNLVSLENEELLANLKSSKSKLVTGEQQLNYSIDQKKKYVASAPIEGEIVKEDFKLGDTVKPGDTIAVIANVNKMEFNIPIDELDIAKIKIGQKVRVSIDALSQTAVGTIDGVVSKIAPEGTSNNGVTTYPVTISLLNKKGEGNGSENILSGMNATGEIIISGKSNVLSVPLEAVQYVGQDAYVMVKGNKKEIEKLKAQRNYKKVFNSIIKGQSVQNSNNDAIEQYYSDTVPKKVTVGVSNAQSIEIVSGLKPGEKVMLPPIQPAAADANQNAEGDQGMGGGI